MRPSAPKTMTWILGLIAGIIGIVDHFTPIPYVTSTYAFWLLVGGFALLAIGTTFKGI